MRRTSLAAALVAGFFASGTWITASGQSGDSGTTSQNGTVMATRLSSGSDGQSHIGQIAIALKTAQDAPVERSAAQKVSDAYVVRAPPGMFEDWHNADKKRYIVVISGEAEITTTGGEKASIVPGQIYLAADLTGKGHTFRVVGKQQWVALFVNFAE
jgi:quercetin dioxygenase-like cupin family protein